MKSAEVVESVPATEGELTEGEKSAAEGQAGAGEDERKRLVLVLREVNEIANRGGAVEEKFLELRARLGKR